MTTLIVALDAPSRWYASDGTLYSLVREASVSWVKIGPQTALVPEVWEAVLTNFPMLGVNVFADLKLADTWDTVVETVTRLRELGVAAVSTSTMHAMSAAASVNNILTWHLVARSDDYDWSARESWRSHHLPTLASGVICPAAAAKFFVEEADDLGGPYDVVVPGVRFVDDDPDGHYLATQPSRLRELGVDYAVVGRPIWQASDPVAAAVRYREALA